RMAFYYERAEKFFTVLGLFLRTLMPHLRYVIVRQEFVLHIHRAAAEVHPFPIERRPFCGLATFQPKQANDRIFQHNYPELVAFHKALGNAVKIIRKSATEFPALIAPAYCTIGPADHVFEPPLDRKITRLN